VAKRSEIEAVADKLGLPLARIGVIVAGGGCKVRTADGSLIQTKEKGYDHFA